jgi:hypothetical protein
MVDALAIGKGGDMVKSVEGYLISAKYKVGMTKKKKGSTLYTIESKIGERVDFWGNASINAALCVNDKLNPGLVNRMIKIVFVKMGKKVPGKNPQRHCDVMVDDADKRTTAGSRDYSLKK